MWAVRIILLSLLLFEVLQGAVDTNLMWIGLIITSASTLIALEVINLYLRRHEINHVPSLTHWLILAAVSIDALGNIQNWYSDIRWFDSVVHFMSGVALTYVLVYLGFSFVQIHHLILPRTIVLYFAVATTVVLGILFEFIEYIIDTVVGSPQWLGSGTDTVIDMMACLLGAVVTVAFMLEHVYSKKITFPEP